MFAKSQIMCCIMSGKHQVAGEKQIVVVKVKAKYVDTNNIVLM